MVVIRIDEIFACNNLFALVSSIKKAASEVLLQQSNVITHIEMYGQNSSMNVAQATAIALYELTKD